MDDLLQAQGPGVTLPYDTSVRWVIREQVAYTLQAYPGLRVSSDSCVKPSEEALQGPARTESLA